MESIKCLNPHIIINRRAVELLLRFPFAKLFLNGVRYTGRLMDKLNKFNYSKFGPKQFNVVSTALEYFFVEAGNIRLPFYLAVPCGKCALCRKQMRDDWSARFCAETAMSVTLPVFFTLTYDDAHLPVKDEILPIWNKKHTQVTSYQDMPKGVRKYDVQLFMKKLRFRLSEMGWTKKIRYVVVGEYGQTNTFRPHYHVTLFNFPDADFFKCVRSSDVYADDINYIRACEKFLHTLWDKCSPRKEFDFDYCGVIKKRDPKTGRRFRVLNNKGNGKGCAKYVAKYIRKKGVVPSGSAPCFLLASNRNGGIGIPYLKTQLKFYSDPSSSQFIYIKNPYTHTCDKFLMPSLFRHWLFPCKSAIVPRKLREYARSLYRSVNSLNLVSRKCFGHSCDFFTRFPITHALSDFLPFEDTNDINTAYTLADGTVVNLLKLTPWTDKFIVKRLFLELKCDCSFYDDLLTCESSRFPSFLDRLARSDAYHSFISSLPLNLREYDVKILNSNQEYYDNLSLLKNTF